MTVMNVNEFLNLLLSQAILKYVIDISGFTDTEAEEIVSIIPNVIAD